MKLLNDLLDLAILEAEKMHYVIKENDMIAQIDTIISELSSRSREKCIQIIKPASSENKKLPFDKIRITQVLRNLLLNAIHFSAPNGEIQFKITEIEQSGEQFLQVTVSDQGIGLPTEELKTIFDKFTLSSKTKTGAGGTGLGLAICKQIITDHNGKIWAENNPNGGALFCFSLPMQN